MNKHCKIVNHVELINSFAMLQDILLLIMEKKYMILAVSLNLVLLGII